MSGDRRRLADHIREALAERAAQMLQAKPHDKDPTVWAETVADHVEEVAGALVCALGVQLVNGKRRDSRSAFVNVMWRDRRGRAHPLVSVRVRDLAGAGGLPIDAPATVRELRWQWGDGIPDDPRALE